MRALFLSGFGKNKIKTEEASKPLDKKWKSKGYFLYFFVQMKEKKNFLNQLSGKSFFMPETQTLSAPVVIIMIILKDRSLGFKNDIIFYSDLPVKIYL